MIHLANNFNQNFCLNFLGISLCVFCGLQAFTALKELDLTWEAVHGELTVLTQATGLSFSAGSVMPAITALLEMAQLSLDHVRKDITACMETPLRNLSHRLQVNTRLYQTCTACSQIQELQYSIV